MVSISTSSSRKHKPSLKYNIGALLTVIVWGVSFVSTKKVLDAGLLPTQVHILRASIAYILLLIVCHRRILSNSWRDELLFVVCGMCGNSLYFIAENHAMEHTLVSNVSLIVTLSPLLTILLVGLLYKNERPSRGVVFGSIVAFLGVGLVIFNSSFVLAVKPLGDLLALAAAMLWAVYSVLIRKLSPFYSSLYITRKTFFYGVVTAIPFLLGEDAVWNLDVLANPVIWGNFLFLGVMCSMLAFLSWSWIIKGLGAVKANNFLYLQPIITLIASAILLGEKVTWVGYTGCAMILLGVLLTEHISPGLPSKRHR